MTAFRWEDPLLLEEQLSEDERLVRDAARNYCQGKLAPRVQMAFRQETSDPAIFRVCDLMCDSMEAELEKSHRALGG